MLNDADASRFKRVYLATGFTVYVLSLSRYSRFTVYFSALYDGSIVGWEVYEEESADCASSLILFRVRLD